MISFAILGTKLKDAVVWYVPKKDPYRSAQRATTNYSKIKLHFPKIVHLEHCPGKYCTSRHQTQVCYSLGCSKERSIAPLANGLHELFKKRPEKLWLRKFVQIAHCPCKYFASRYQIPVCCSLKCSTERFVAFCSKWLHQLFKNRSTKVIVFPKSCPHSTLPKQILCL